MIKSSFNKVKVNLVIDVIMLFLLMTMAGLGFLIKYVLVAGFKRNELYGGNVELYYLGRDRHEWGSIHLLLAFVFLFLLLIHIILHWKMILCIFRQMFSGKFSRLIISGLTGILVLFFALAPLLVKPDVQPLPRKHFNRIHVEPVTGQTSGSIQRADGIDITTTFAAESLREAQNHDEKEHAHSGLEIYGYMTLEEVSLKFGIPVEKLTSALNIPADESKIRIGILKRRHGLEMADIKEKILILR